MSDQVLPGVGGRPYVVWRRSDGYVGCTRGEPHNSRDTFDVLLRTHDWPEAHDRVLAEQDDKHRAVVASWLSPSDDIRTDSNS